MRAIWRGAVSFGLVNVPVRLYAATAEHDIRFHQVHRTDGGRIRYRRTCSVCGEEVAYDDIAKGYETGDGQLVILTDEDLDQLPLATGHEIDVVEFVPVDQVDPILFAKCYYLEPEARSLKPYALLREALVATERMAVVKVALRQRETLAVLRVRDRAILLQTMLWPDEVRAAEFDVLDGEVELRPQELSMASSLVESLAADFEPEQFTDNYRSAVEAMVESKIERGDTSRVPGAPEEAAAAAGGGEVVDLLTALQRSVDRARGSSAPEPTEAAPATSTAAKGASVKGASVKGASATKAAAKKAPAKKAPAKKAPAKQAATKKTAAKKAPAKKEPAKKAARRSA